jgi:hypothetical protein
MANLKSRIEQLEAAAELGRRTRILWNPRDVKKAIAAMIAAGAAPDDKFLVVAWLPAGTPEKPMGEARWDTDTPRNQWPFPSRDPPPEPDNDDAPPEG